MQSKMSAIFNYFVKVKLEFSKIVWLKPKELYQLLATVLVSSILCACFFAIIDMIFNSLIMTVIFG